MKGLGIDAVDVERFRAVLTRRPSILERMFGQVELADSQRRADSVPSLAARFAAKEATMKALGVGISGFSLREVQVHLEESGAPRLVLAGKAEKLAESLGVTSLSVSLTHTAITACAIVVAE